MNSFFNRSLTAARILLNLRRYTVFRTSCVDVQEIPIILTVRISVFFNLLICVRQRNRYANLKEVFIWWFFHSLNICSLFHAPVCKAWLAIYYLKHWQVRGRVGYVTLLTFFHFSMEYGCLDYRYYENVTMNLVFVPLVRSLSSRSLKFRNSFTLKFQIIFDIYSNWIIIK